MLINKKCILGTTLFSAFILTSLSAQNVKADTTTGDATTATTKAALSNATVSNVSMPNTPVTSTAPLITPVTSATTTTTANTGTVPSPKTTVTVTTPSTSTTTSTSTSSSVNTGAGVTTPSTSTTTSTSTSSSVNTGAGVTTPSTSTTTSTSKSGSVNTGTGVTTPSTSTTTSTSTSSSGNSGAGVTLPASSIPTTTPTATTSTTNPTTTTTDNYAIASNITDATVVDFTDPTLAAVVKNGLGLPATANITVGDIRNYNRGVTLEVNEGSYLSTNSATANLTETQYTPIESLNGIQYLKLLPSDMIDLRVRLASDAKADPDLTPLNGIKFNGLELIGNFSNPNAKEINVSQITQLTTPEYQFVDFYGDQDYNGINNAELKTLAPWIIAYSNNGQTADSLVLNGNSITDYSPLKNINRTASFSFNVTGGSYNSQLIYAVKGQPITFNAQAVTGIDGEDLAGAYNFSTTVPEGTAKIYNLKNLGNDQYELDGADQSATSLMYGDAGFSPTYNPNYSMDGITYKKYGTDSFIDNFVNAQPLIWQNHPSVTIAYVDSQGQPLKVNGQALTKTVSGTNIGDSFDLTNDVKIAGYTLVNPKINLKGTYTQNPQFITLAYKQNSTPANSSPEKPAKAVLPKVKFRGPQKVVLHTVTDNVQDKGLADIGVKATTTINGKLFYLLGDGQFIEASSYQFVKTAVSVVVRTLGETVTPVNAYGQAFGSVLAANSAWKYSRIVNINGADYYQIATDEFIPTASSVNFESITRPTKATLISSAEIYNSQGKSIGQKLTRDSSWRTDGWAIINGVKMYRIATDEWISGQVIKVSQL